MKRKLLHLALTFFASLVVTLGTYADTQTADILEAIDGINLLSRLNEGTRDERFSVLITTR